MKMSSASDVNKGQQLPGLQGLQGLPTGLLDAVLSQLDASSRLPVFMTSKLLATALLRVVPRIQLTYPTQHDIIGQDLRELAPFLTEVLQNRQHPKLHLTLQPASSLTDAIDAIEQRVYSEPDIAVPDATQLVAWTLGAVPQCGAVDSLAISWQLELLLPWEPEFSAALAASFPSLTSLTFPDCSISIGDLADVINHPLLLPRLLHLDLKHVTFTHDGQLGRSPFVGSRLQNLCLCGVVEGDGEPEFLSGLLPLPPTLTQLRFRGSIGDQWVWDWDMIGAAVSSLKMLRQLALSCQDSDYDNLTTSGVGPAGPEPMALLPWLVHLPSLHALEMYERVVGQEQLDALLALTQITRLEVYNFSDLTSSRASAACSWRQLEIWRLDWFSAAYLPLHSLTHPLRLHKLMDVEEPSIEVLAAAELNLCERNKAGLVLDEGMYLHVSTLDLLTEQYLSHSRRTAQQLTQPTVASSSHSGPSTSLASSSSPEGHITPGGPGSNTGLGRQQGSAAGGQALMQRLGRYVKKLDIQMRGRSSARLSSANQQALDVLFPYADVTIVGY
ncbi:hypothetical protein QJQ45_003751 [Haematococcus lacustris]|nr:hypothetical protein QJQ45_003751 [Haematococcus lacustris]